MSPKTLITRKIGMTSAIDQDGIVRAVTLLGFDTHVVTQVKTIDKDGYNAVQFGSGKAKNPKKAQAGHTKAAKITPAIMREYRTADTPEINVGDTFETDVFAVGDNVDVTGLNKGKGWAGTIKRHNFHRGRKTHGGRSYRRVGSIGSMYPQHILKGKKMSGQMGNTQVTVKNLKVAIIDNDKKVIGVYGSVPGPRKNILVIKEAK